MKPLAADRLRGSLRGCLDLTGLPAQKVAERLMFLAHLSGAVVSPGADTWRPRGRSDYKETTLVEGTDFIQPDISKSLIGWWLKVARRARLPNWDIASTCLIEGKRGLVLIEAKAHDNELSADGKRPPTTANGRLNHVKIGRAIEEANAGLNSISKRWALSRDSYYQLSNRFAWTWKLTSLGVPVVLVYLGFLNAKEMCDQGCPFSSHAVWENHLRLKVKDHVPNEAWNTRFKINGTPAWFLIKSMELPSNQV